MFKILILFFIISWILGIFTLQKTKILKCTCIFFLLRSDSLFLFTFMFVQNLRLSVFFVKFYWQIYWPLLKINAFWNWNEHVKWACKSWFHCTIKWKSITLWMNIQYVHVWVCTGLIQVYLIFCKFMSANCITAQVKFNQNILPLEYNTRSFCMHFESFYSLYKPVAFFSFIL